MATRRYGTIVRHLSDDPDTASELAAKLSGDVLHHLAEALHDEARQRAIRSGDHDALRSVQELRGLAKRFEGWVGSELGDADEALKDAKSKP